MEIFFNDRRIIIEETIDIKSDADIQTSIYNFLNDNNVTELLFKTQNAKILLNGIKQYFKYIEAAGGVVLNQNRKKFLLLERFGKCDLPKGKIENNETPEIAALREVSEECGVFDLKITEKLNPTFHIYFQNKKYFLKKTFWFEMINNSNEAPTPQTAENITKVYWTDVFVLDQCLNNTYSNLKPLFKQFAL